ncbi:hypothetical protein [Corallococcus llansteffanensis]|uniref:DUF4157 domain-containing protein n=1 Tax=Corallococcus llansteffanensis TaxID=2316731 RepID=A0A3A8QJ50_9BACT|nr:hypothetical protein [Corallococcus llansteffanensis]RKH68779.1 hypothetical protein D7V93_00890 [Corallococcus llansteffanensis]
MKIQSKAPLPEPRKALAAGEPAPAKSPGAAPAETSGATARKAGFSQDSEFSRKQPDVASTFRREFGALASDKQQFHDTMRTVYGEGYNAIQAEQFRQKAQGGDFGWLPKVKLVPPETLEGACGAYDAASGTVLINDSLDPTLAASTFVEEAGHHLDTKLNTQDTVGDEGELFRRVLSGEKLSPGQVSELRAENDKGTLQIDGKATEVEFRKKGLFKRAANFLGGTAKAVGNAFKDAGEFVGGLVDGGAKAVGKAATAVWKGVQTMAPRVGDATRSLLTGVKSTLVGQARNLSEGVGTFFGGVGKLFQGKGGEGLKQMGLGLVKVFVQSPVDVLLMSGGRTISAVQTLIGVEPLGRKPTAEEIATLRQVYGDSIDYSAMRIKEGKAGLFSGTQRAFTHGDTIYIPPEDMPMTSDLLVHESAHVWQHQNGGTDYMSEALWAQHFGAAYEFAGALDAGKTWSELDPEQQGQFLSEAQRLGYFNEPAGARPFIAENGTDYTAVLVDALAQVRAGKGAP